MSAISHVIGGDLILDSAGGLAVVDIAEEARQAILRRLCTNAGDYPWHLDYGVGLPARIGSPMQEGDIQAVTLVQLQQESAVDQSQAPTVTITDQGAGQYLCVIQYVDQQTQTVQGLSFSA